MMRITSEGQRNKGMKMKTQRFKSFMPVANILQIGTERRRTFMNAVHPPLSPLSCLGKIEMKKFFGRS